MATAKALLLRSATTAATSKRQDTQSQHLSPLESLPVELIQHIFFYSFEVNMARASAHLARVLSKPSIYNALILFAYFDDHNNDDDEDGENLKAAPVETHHFRPAEYRRISLGEKIRLQQGILGCKWFTVDRLKASMPTLSRLQMVQAWHREHEAEKYKCRNHRGEASRAQQQQQQSLDVPPVVANEMLRSVAALPALDDEVGMEKHFFATLEMEATGRLRWGRDGDGQGQQHQHQHQQSTSRVIVFPTGANVTLPRIIAWDCSLDANGYLHKTVSSRAISTLAARVLPDHLVRGHPWTASKLELLQLLRQGMRFLVRDQILEISAAALFAGMTSAIREGNDKALLVLLELHYATMRLDPTRDLGLVDGGRRYLVAPFAHPVPVELFYLAVKQEYTNTSTNTNTKGQIYTAMTSNSTGPGQQPTSQGYGFEQHEHNPNTNHQHQHQHDPNTNQQHDHGPSADQHHHTSTSRILTLLLREGIDSIGVDDKILTRWATHTWTHSALPSERKVARWLLDYMSGSDDYGLNRDEPLFVNGMMAAQRRRWRAGEDLFPNTSFTEEIGYLSGGAAMEVVRARDGRPCG